MNKKITDILAMVCLLIAIVTGFMLHSEVHHKLVYDNELLWGIHETVGIVMAIAIILHCVQHKYWFVNYMKIPVAKKRVTTILLCVLIVVIVTGVILMFGSHSHGVSIIHYALGIIVTLLAIGHVVKRWRIYSGLKF